MKTVIATVIALSAAAPAFADVSNAQAFFALSNDSAAERIVGETSVGDTTAALWAGVNANESAAEKNIVIGGGDVSRDVNVLLSLGNDSPAEVLK